MKFKAVKTVRAYPDGFTAFDFIEGKEVELEPDMAAFCIERGIVEDIKPKVETKPLAIEDKETKPLIKKKAVKK